MSYVAHKPCRLAGQSFLIGDTIPDEFVHPGAAKNLIKMGIIGLEGETTLTAKNDEAKEPITVYVHADEGELMCNPTEEGLQQVFDVLQGSATDAEAIINAMTDTDALILIDVCEKRKTVKEVVKTRGLQLAEEAGETRGLQLAEEAVKTRGLQLAEEAGE